MKFDILETTTVGVYKTKHGEKKNEFSHLLHQHFWEFALGGQRPLKELQFTVKKVLPTLCMCLDTEIKLLSNKKNHYQFQTLGGGGEKEYSYLYCWRECQRSQQTGPGTVAEDPASDVGSRECVSSGTINTIVEH